MQGVGFVTNAQNERVSVLIDLNVLAGQQEDLEDFLDVVLAEARRTEDSLDWKDAKALLKANTKG